MGKRGVPGTYGAEKAKPSTPGTPGSTYPVKDIQGHTLVIQGWTQAQAYRPRHRQHIPSIPGKGSGT